MTQDSIVARDAAELRMELLMRDFKAAVEEVAGIASNPSATNVTQHSNSSDISLQTRQKSDTGESERLPPPPARKNSTPRRSVTASTGLGVSQGGPRSVGWIGMQAQMNDICGRWTNARRDAKAAVFGCVSVHPSTGTYIKCSEWSAAREGTKGKGKGKRDTGTFEDFDVSAFSGSISSNASDGSNASSMTGGPFVQLGGLLGSASSPHYVAGRAEGSGGSGYAVELDLSRVHALQRKLVEFSQLAFHATQQRRVQQHERGRGDGVGYGAHLDASVSEDMSLNRDTSGIADSKLDTLGSQVETEKCMVQLRAISRELLLQCSALAPLAPLTSQSCASSGLEQFINEACAVFVSRFHICLVAFLSV